jgi:TonB family protein
MSTPVYDPSKVTKKTSGVPYLWATLVTVGIFILLPLTQYISSVGDDDKDFNRVNVSEPPPELPPPPEPEPEEEQEQEDAPELENEPEPISLTDLQVSLNAGTGGFGATMGVVNFDQMGPSLDEMIFDVKDLDRKPRVIKQGRLEYPFELKRERIEGFVRLKIIIDEGGRVKVAEVVDSSHRAFVKPAIEAAESSVFESPTRNGQKVKAYYYLPFRFALRG